jgi:hypothetical protein
MSKEVQMNIANFEFLHGHSKILDVEPMNSRSAAGMFYPVARLVDRWMSLVDIGESKARISYWIVLNLLLGNNYELDHFVLLKALQGGLVFMEYLQQAA